MNGASPARVEAARILGRIERDAAFAAPLLAGERVGNLSPEDRRLTKELVLGVLRHRGELDFVINVVTGRPAERLDLPVRIALWIGLYQIRHLERVPPHAAVAESVELIKQSSCPQAAALVNAALRTALRERPDAPDDRVRDPLNRLSIATSHPRWLLERWSARLGAEEAATLARSHNTIPRTAFRINPLRAPSRARVLTELAANGVDVADSTLRSGAMVVAGGHLTPSSRAITEGWILVQDEASQIVADLVAPRPGERVLDVGAAPGGKTTQLAAMMANSGLVVAVERRVARAVTLAAMCARMAARCVRIVAADATADLPISDGLVFDRVLVDAPCSGTGTLRRNPEIRWRIVEADLAGLAGRQGELLDRAAERVRPGGRLVYSTCSLEPEENESVVAALLERRSDLRVVADAVPGRLRTPDGFLRTWPHRDGADGFFAAVLERHDPGNAGILPGPGGAGFQPAPLRHAGWKPAFPN